jgi:molecular chaperone GrpE
MANRKTSPLEDRSSIPADVPGADDVQLEPDDSVHSRQVLLAQNADLQDRLLRALSEGENTRRRADRAVSEARKFAVSEFAREMLAVWDNLQRTIAASERQRLSSADDVLIEGVRATERILTSALERFGLVKIAALYAPFDPNLHEAVMEVDDPSRPSGSVATVLEDGFKLHDRLVRAARVAVVKRRPGSVNMQADEVAADSDASQRHV